MAILDSSSTIYSGDKKMIINARELHIQQRENVAKKVSALSHKTNSSLLQKSELEVLKIIDSGIVYVKIEDERVLFSIAFETTPHPDFIEVGMTCNLEKELVHGKDIFPLIIKRYRQINGNGKKTLYLTTTDTRLINIASKSGFKKAANIITLFPPAVLDFCCAPCQASKTGVKCNGDQFKECPRFIGDYVPKDGDEVTHNPCLVFIQKL